MIQGIIAQLQCRPLLVTIYKEHVLKCAESFSVQTGVGVKI